MPTFNWISWKRFWNQWANSQPREARESASKLRRFEIEARYRWRLERLRFEYASCLKENQNKENERCSKIKSVPAVGKTCSGKFEYLLLISILPENKLLHKYPILTIYWKIFKTLTFLKNASSQTFSWIAST